MAPRVKGLAWLGIRTDKFDEQRRFFADTLGLRLVAEEPGFAAYRLPDGELVEVFSLEYESSQAFTTGPVVGFSVEDIDATRTAMEADGIEFLGPTESDERLGRWAHFRGPDGNVYEITWRKPK